MNVHIHPRITSTMEFLIEVESQNIEYMMNIDYIVIAYVEFSFLQTLYDWLKASNLISSNSLSEMLDTCSFEV